MSIAVDFNQLYNCNLIKDAIYSGGDTKNLSSEPISKLLPVGNQSGIRFLGSNVVPRLVVLYSTFIDPDWPDSINGQILTYYGDNKKPGNEIHDLPGNKLFRTIFNNLHLNRKKEIPPIFLFSKGYKGYNRIFKGLIVPGYSDYDETQDLIAIWKTKEAQRFQNYKATFTILSVDIIHREWIIDITSNNPFSNNMPIEWFNWINS